VNAAAFAFVRAIAVDKILPVFKWDFSISGNAIRLRITTDSLTNRAAIWFSKSPGRDFRQSEWESMPMHIAGKNDKFQSGTNEKVYEMKIAIPENGFIALFGEVECRDEQSVFLLSTQMNISGAVK
jgi:hypothetical protein